MTRGRARLEWDQTAALWVPLAEPLRDRAEHPEPFSARDIHPLLRDEPSPEQGEPDWALWSKLTQNVTVQIIDLTKLHEHASN